MPNEIITYFLLTGMINIFVNCWLLNIVEEPRTTTYAQKAGAFAFYLTAFMIGFIMIPIIIATAAGALLTKK